MLRPVPQHRHSTAFECSAVETTACFSFSFKVASCHLSLSSLEAKPWDDFAVPEPPLSWTGCAMAFTLLHKLHPAPSLSLVLFSLTRPIVFSLAMMLDLASDLGPGPGSGLSIVVSA